MIDILYCELCDGKPYYNIEIDSSHSLCPYCHSVLTQKVYYDVNELNKKHVKMENYCPGNSIIDSTQKEPNKKNTADVSNKNEEVDYVKNDSRDESVSYDSNKGLAKSDESTTDLMNSDASNSNDNKFYSDDSINNDSVNEKENNDRAKNKRIKRSPVELGEKKNSAVTKESFSTDTVDSYRNASSISSGEIVNYDNRNILHGKIVSVRTDEKYQRPFFEKVLQKIRYGQRMSNIRNTFNVNLTNDDGKEIKTNGVIRNVDVIIHGAIAGGTDITSHSQKSIIAEGRYSSSDDEFFAKNISIDKRQKQVEVENSDILIFAIPILIVGLVIFLLSLIPDGMSFTEAISYVKDRIIMFVCINFCLSMISAYVLYRRTRLRGIRMFLGRPPRSFGSCFQIGLVISTIVTIAIMCII